MKRRMVILCLLVLTLIAGILIMRNTPVEAAQPSRTNPADADDLHAVYTTAADAAEGKRVAETACARCHGANGISATKGVPHLAG